MTAAIVNLLQGDFHSLIAEDAKALGFLPQDMDVTELKPILTKILTEGLLESGSNLHERKRKLLDMRVNNQQTNKWMKRNTYTLRTVCRDCAPNFQFHLSV